MIVVFSTLPSTVERTPKRDLADIDLVRIIWTDRDDVVEAELPVARRRWQLAPAIAAILSNEQSISSVGVEPRPPKASAIRPKPEVGRQPPSAFHWTPVRSVDLKMPWLEKAT
jgi:hypothetical protein